jgi:hypothetical protein
LAFGRQLCCRPKAKRMTPQPSTDANLEYARICRHQLFANKGLWIKLRLKYAI